MEKILFAIVLVFVLYDLLSLVKILVKIKKAGRTNCSFKMSLSKIVFWGMRILLTTGAALIYIFEGNKGWLPFLGLSIMFVVDFIVEGVEVNERKTNN